MLSTTSELGGARPTSRSGKCWAAVLGAGLIGAGTGLTAGAVVNLTVGIVAGLLGGGGGALRTYSTTRSCDGRGGGGARRGPFGPGGPGGPGGIVLILILMIIGGGLTLQTDSLSKIAGVVVWILSFGLLAVMSVVDWLVQRKPLPPGQSTM